MPKILQNQQITMEIQQQISAITTEQAILNEKIAFKIKQITDINNKID